MKSNEDHDNRYADRPNGIDQIFDNLIAFERPLDVEEIAVFLQKKPNTIRNWVASGAVKIPHFRLGNKTMFLKSSVVEWLRCLQRKEKPRWL